MNPSCFHLKEHIHPTQETAGSLDYNNAWDQAIEEYNNYGVNALTAKYRIDATSSKLMFGFKAHYVTKNMLQYEIMSINNCQKYAYGS